MEAKSHSNFFSVVAKDNFEFGVLMGEKFGEFARNTINENIQRPDWSIRQERAKEYLDVTNRYFPNYVAELQGYAEGAKVDFLNLWTTSLEEEVHQGLADKCTTIVTNEGKLISHNEDWGKDSENHVCLLLKKVGEITILELYYLNTLGGNSISINSHGFVISVNTLVHSDKKLGIPRNVIARWLSETKNPEGDFLKLKKLPRSLGFSFNILNRKGEIWNIEYNSQGATLVRPHSPYVHTNHYLAELKSYEMNDNSSGSFDRYEVACSKVKPRMTVSELIDLTNDKSRGDLMSIMNERTIAKMVIDLENLVVKVWMRRENNIGFVDYKLDKFLGW